MHIWYKILFPILTLIVSVLAVYFYQKVLKQNKILISKQDEIKKERISIKKKTYLQKMIFEYFSFLDDLEKNGGKNKTNNWKQKYEAFHKYILSSDAVDYKLVKETKYQIGFIKILSINYYGVIETNQNKLRKLLTTYHNWLAVQIYLSDEIIFNNDGPIRLEKFEGKTAKELNELISYSNQHNIIKKIVRYMKSRNIPSKK